MAEVTDHNPLPWGHFTRNSWPRTVTRLRWTGLSQSRGTGSLVRSHRALGPSSSHSQVSQMARLINKLELDSTCDRTGPTTPLDWHIKNYLYSSNCSSILGRWWRNEENNYMQAHSAVWLCTVTVSYLTILKLWDLISRGLTIFRDNFRLIIDV